MKYALIAAAIVGAVMAQAPTTLPKCGVSRKLLVHVSSTLR
jgi:hypothetical protein